MNVPEPRAGQHGARPRIGIVGCGAVTERFHLPALQRLGMTPSVLVDLNRDRAESLAAEFGVAHVVTDADATPEYADAAIVAIPATFHASVTCSLMRLGLHAIVEKPMAMTRGECEEMIDTAKATGRVLTVGLMRRHLAANVWLKKLIDSGALGRITSFDVREGVVFDWPVASPSFYTFDGGGGVLADTGAHTVDWVLWLLGDPVRFEYFDDNEGGVEADCLVHLDMASGSSGTIELSRTRNLRNTIVVEGTDGRAEVDRYGRKVDAQPRSMMKRKVDGIRGDSVPGQSIDDLFEIQLRNWLDAIVEGTPVAVDPVDAARSVELINKFYERRQRLVYPWSDLAVSQEPLRTGPT